MKHTQYLLQCVDLILHTKAVSAEGNLALRLHSGWTQRQGLLLFSCSSFDFCLQNYTHGIQMEIIPHRGFSLLISLVAVI